MRNKMAIRLTALLLALVLCVGTLAGCASVRKPLIFLKRSVIGTLEKSLGGELMTFLMAAVNHGCIELEIGENELTESLPQALSLKLWTDTENRRIAAQGNITLNGNTYDGALWVNETEAALSSATFLGSSNLGLDFTTLKNDLKTSIFSNNSGTAYARPEISEDSAATVTGFKDAMFSMLGSSDEVYKLFDEALEVFLSELTENASNSRYKQDGRTYVSLTVNNDALSRTLRATRARLVKDRSFCRGMRDLAATLDAMHTSQNGEVTNEYTTKLEYFISSEADMDVLCLKIDNAAPFTLQLDATVRNFGSALEGVKCVYTVDGTQKWDANLYLAQNDGVSSLTVTLDGVTRTLTYQVTKDSFKGFGAVISYEKRTADGVVLASTGALEADRRADTFVLTLVQGGQTRSFSGQYAFDKNCFSLKVNAAVVNGEAKKMALSLTVTKDADAPALPQYVNLATITTARYEPILERATSTKEQFLADWTVNGTTPYALLCDLFRVLDLEEETPPPPAEEEPGDTAGTE